MFGWTELLVVFGALILIFGASRIPSIARSLGESVGEFKDALEDSPDQETSKLPDEEENDELQNNDN